MLRLLMEKIRKFQTSSGGFEKMGDVLRETEEVNNPNLEGEARRIMDSQKIIYVNDDLFDNNKQVRDKIEHFLRSIKKEKMNVKSDYDELNEVIEDALRNERKLNVENLCFEIKKEQEFIQRFYEAKRESIFEFKILRSVGILSYQKTKRYIYNKQKCDSLITKLLFQGTTVDCIASILQDNFLISTDCWFGLGIYFTDQLDYATFYSGSKQSFNDIPKLGEVFPVIASEVYYNPRKFKRINDMSYKIILNRKRIHERDKVVEENRDKAIIKDGIYYAEVEPIGVRPIPNGVKIEKGFVGREYVITYNEQILPLYGVIMERVEYCIIWRNANPRTREFTDELKRLYSITEYNIYTEKDNLRALSLVWRKKYNKIILISDIGKNKEGKEFIDKARKILQSYSLLVLFFDPETNDTEWIYNYNNTLFTKHIKFLEDYITSFGKMEQMMWIKKKLEEVEGKKFKEFSDDLFNYKLFNSTLNEKNKYYKLDTCEIPEIFLYEPL